MIQKPIPKKVLPRVTPWQAFLAFLSAFNRAAEASSLYLLSPDDTAIGNASSKPLSFKVTDRVVQSDRDPIQQSINTSFNSHIILLYLNWGRKDERLHNHVEVQPKLLILSYALPRIWISNLHPIIDVSSPVPVDSNLFLWVFAHDERPWQIGQIQIKLTCQHGVVAAGTDWIILWDRLQILALFPANHEAPVRKYFWI